MTADKRLRKALKEVRRALDKIGVPWMIIGGIAVIAHGVLRQTRDIDATLWGPEIHGHTIDAERVLGLVRQIREAR